MKVSTVSEMRALDKAAIEEFGIVEELLMENAGHAAYYVLLKEIGIRGKRFVIFCGVGNNGGDGFVVARKIHSSGGEVVVFILGDKGKFHGAARTNLDIISRLPIDFRQVENVESLELEIGQYDAIVDAIFGTGLSRDVGGVYREVIEWMNASGAPILSVDIPSGVHGDTGQIMGVAVEADYTVTFGLPKFGNMLQPGYNLCGKLYVSHISFPPSLYNASALHAEINPPAELPSEAKGVRGEVLTIALAVDSCQAALLVALSALSAGGRHSRLAVPVSMMPTLMEAGSPIVMAPMEETSSGGLSLSNKEALLQLSESADMVILCPGLSLEGETRQLVLELAMNINKPLLVNGDRIVEMLGNDHIPNKQRAGTILILDPIELSSINNTPVDDFNLQKINILRRAAGELRVTIVLTGVQTLIGYPAGEILINTSGSSAMATAELREVLVGTIAAMFGQGLSPREAVGAGVFLHGLAMDLASMDVRLKQFTAQDILGQLPLAVEMDREGLPESLWDRYRGAQVI